MRLSCLWWVSADEILHASISMFMLTWHNQLVLKMWGHAGTLQHALITVLSRMSTINNVMYMSFGMIVISDDRCVHACTHCSNVYIGVLHQHMQ